MSDTSLWREYATNAISYWEPRRIVHNLVLLTIVTAYFVIGLPHSRPVLFDVNTVLVLFVLCVLANVAYCAAYIVDVLAQASGFRDLWLRLRWALFLLGIAFAGTLTRFWAIGIFGTN
jgi:hypothetical protein